MNTEKKKNMENPQTTELIVSSGQYETDAIIVKVRHTTQKGLMRRARQLSKKHAVYGDNWAGWILANVAIADPENDEWGENQILGGRWCNPANGWLQL